MGASGRSLPVASWTCACNGSCAPTAIVDDEGLTTTAATPSPVLGSVSVELLHDNVIIAAAPSINHRPGRAGRFAFARSRLIGPPVTPHTLGGFGACAIRRPVVHPGCIPNKRLRRKLWRRK